MIPGTFIVPMTINFNVQLSRKRHDRNELKKRCPQRNVPDSTNHQHLMWKHFMKGKPIHKLYVPVSCLVAVSSFEAFRHG